MSDAYEDYGTSDSEGRQATRDPAYWAAYDDMWDDTRNVSVEFEGDWLERQDARHG